MTIGLKSLLLYKNELMRLALHITMDRAEAEDVVQETYIKVWSQHEHWNEIENMKAYCLTVCRNLALDKHRAARTKTESIDALPIEQAGVIDPSEMSEHNERITLVRSMMQQLPEKQRTAMQLRDFEGYSYKEISDIMEVPEQQVKINIFRARQAIKQKIFEKKQPEL